jgi:hypothetical protein
MALTTGQQADVDELRAIATAYEVLEGRVLTLYRLWTRNDNNSGIGESEEISETLVGGDVKKAMAGLNKRFTETLVEGGENTLNLISKVALP